MHECPAQKGILTGVGGFLDGVAAEGLREEVWVIRETKEKRSFFHDLENGMLDWRRRGFGKRVQIERDDGNPVGKLLWKLLLSLSYLT